MNDEEKLRSVHMNAFTTYGSYISKQAPIKNELDGLEKSLEIARDKVNAANAAYKRADKEHLIALNKYNAYNEARRLYDYAAREFAYAGEEWDDFIIAHNDEEEANE